MSDLAATAHSAPVHPSDRQLLASFVLQRASIDIGEERDHLLVARLEPLALKFGLSGIEEIVRRLRLDDKSLAAEVIDAMTTNETLFFRDKKMFGDLVTHVIPEVIRRRRKDQPVTIWSAAVSSGQEIYSLAMLLDLHFPAITRGEVPVRLLATDISPSMVERCRAGRYSDQEVFRGLPDEYRDKYLDRAGDDWVVNPRLRKLVHCRELNLMDPLNVVPYCDLIFIRNVLIYFSNDVKIELLERIRQKVLRPSGFLTLGASELLLDGRSAYTAVQLPRSMCYAPKPRTVAA